MVAYFCLLGIVFRYFVRLCFALRVSSLALLSLLFHSF